jgi:hypothetical protein
MRESLVRARIVPDGAPEKTTREAHEEHEELFGYRLSSCSPILRGSIFRFLGH